jgi:hypothetical protein
MSGMNAGVGIGFAFEVEDVDFSVDPLATSVLTTIKKVPSWIFSEYQMKKMGVLGDNMEFLITTLGFIPDN